jgi:hypothetical protein
MLVVIDVAVLNCLPHVPHLEPYPHHRGPLDVVGLGEGRPSATGTDVPDNGLDPMVTMVPVRGGRAAPPVKAAISINPAAGTSAPVWAAAAIGDTAAARAPAWSTVGASALVRTAATVPLGVSVCPLRRLLPHCLPCQLELVVSVVIGRNRAAGATGVQSLELCAAARAASAAAAASTSALAATSFSIASLAALATVAAVSATARSRSSAAATSASCRCCTLEATERRDCPSDMAR